MGLVTNVVDGINKVLWDYALLFLLCGTGIWFTIRLKFVQVRRFKDGYNKTFGGLLRKEKRLTEMEYRHFRR